MKPIPYTGRRDDGFATTHHFDGMGIEYETTQDLGPIAGTGTSATSDVTHYHSDGWTVVTVEAVTTGVRFFDWSAPDPVQTTHRIENVLGKPSAVTAGEGVTPATSMTYEYDVDGNLTDTYDTDQNDFHTEYEPLVAARSTTTTRPRAVEVRLRRIRRSSASRPTPKAR